jgi:hypothetical protein
VYEFADYTGISPEIILNHIKWTLFGSEQSSCPRRGREFKIQDSKFKKPEIPNLPVVPLAGRFQNKKIESRNQKAERSPCPQGGKNSKFKIQDSKFKVQDLRNLKLGTRSAKQETPNPKSTNPELTNQRIPN